MSNYKNIVELASQNGFKKIMIRRNGWGYKGYGIVNELVLRSKDDKNGIYCVMFVHYNSGNEEPHIIMPSGKSSWKLL